MAFSNVVSAVPKTASEKKAAEDEALKAEVARLQAENLALRANVANNHAGKPYPAVSKSGGVSVYRLGRFPVTLYQEQWLRVLDIGDEIRAFIKVHASELKAKGQAE